MIIEGPFRLAVLESTDTPMHELHLDFTEAFRALPVEEQVAELRRYLAELHKAILEASEDSDDRAGMLVVQQVAEQLLPHIAAGEVPLTETVVVQIGSDSPLAHLLPGSGTVN